MKGRVATPTNFGLVVAGVLAAFFVGYGAAVGLPLTDGALSAGTEHTLSYSEEAAGGKEIYDREACWYCHTQQVRPVSNDLGLGPVSLPDRFSSDRFAVNGLARMGPDLTCAGDRFADDQSIASQIHDPRARRSTSTMPSYSFFSEEELKLLVTYIASLRCGGEDG